jgi:ribose transport system substrate-binding protein
MWPQPAVSGAWILLAGNWDYFKIYDFKKRLFSHMSQYIWRNFMKRLISAMTVVFAIVCASGCGGGGEKALPIGTSPSAEASVEPSLDGGEAAVAPEAPPEDSPVGPPPGETPLEAPEDEAARPPMDITYRIGILLPDEPGWMAGALERARVRVSELESQGKIEGDIRASKSGEEMAAQFDELFEWKANAIIVAPVWEEAKERIRMALESNTVVVAFGIASEEDEAYGAILDNAGIGRDAAAFVAERIGRSGVVATLDPPSSGALFDLRRKSFLDSLSELAPDATSLSCPAGLSRDAGFAGMKAALAENPEISAVLAMDDEAAIGALQALEESGRTDVLALAGAGGSQEFLRMIGESQDVWLASSVCDLGAMDGAIDMAYGAARGEAVDKEQVFSSTLADKESFDEFLGLESLY